MSQFAKCLNEMRTHHKNNIQEGKRSRYLPSQEFQPFFANNNLLSLDEKGRDVVGGLELYSQNLGRGEADQTESGITTETQTLKDNNVSPSAQEVFKKELEKKREEAKKKANENIDKIYDEALKIGEEYPQYQNEILYVLDKVGGFFLDLYEKISSFVISVVRSVIEWVKNAWESIKSTFNRIAGWISSWF